MTKLIDYVFLGSIGTCIYMHDVYLFGAYCLCLLYYNYKELQSIKQRDKAFSAFKVEMEKAREACEAEQELEELKSRNKRLGLQ